MSSRPDPSSSRRTADTSLLQRGTARPWLVACGLWLALAASAVIALWHLRHEAVASQGRELSLLSLASTDAIDRGLRSAEEGLHVLRAELEEGQLSLAGEAATRDLKARAALIPLVETLWVLDAAGRPIAASDDRPGPDPASFHPPLASLALDTLALGRAFADRNREGEFVAVAVRLARRGTAAGGWIVATTPAAELIGAVGQALPAADAGMLVFRRDDTLLSAVGALPARLPAYEAAARLIDRSRREVRTFDDGSKHLLALGIVARYGVKVLVARDLDAALTSWYRATEVAVVALTLVLLVMAAATWFVQLADRRRAEAQSALQAQASRAGKLESLGTLAGGVAHDFNNVLAGIIGFGEMARDAAAPGSAQERHIDRLLQAALRGKGLVERILAFSRGGAQASTVFELQPVIEEVLALLSPSLRSGIVLDRVFDAAGARVKGDATQAFEATMNLCTNAMQAMPGGGTLGVHLHRIRVNEARVLSHTRLPAGDYVTLAVSDEGGGITPEVMEHLFEPFFTTKAAQSGTGLGLAVVFGVVAEFGGAVDVQSSPGHGARFTIYLPESDDGEAGAGLPVPEESRAERGAGERLLVVDDEPELVALAVELLEGLGYAPTGFTDPAEALRVVEGEPEGFAALVTDEVMPGLTGTQLTLALRKVAPHLPVLLVSGYGGALLARRASAAGVTRVLAKPLQRATLARALAEVLR